MQDFIPRKIDINAVIDTVTVKQFDNDSRYLHVTISDIDLTDAEDNSFDLAECSTALYVKPEGSDDDAAVNFVAGTVESAESGIVTFLLPGGVTQNVGRYECEIWIYQGDETNRPVISTKPFTLVVEKSIKNDSAIVATQSMSALDAKILDIQAVKNQMAALVASPAGSGGDVGTEVRDARVGWDGTEYNSLGDAVRGQTATGFATGLVYLGVFLNKSNWEAYKSGEVESFDALPNNIFAVCNVSESDNTIANAPVSGTMTGLIVTFGRKAKDTRLNFDTQMFIPQDCEKIYIRKYNNSWSDWSVVGGSYISTLPQFRSGVDDTYSVNGGKLSNITDDGTFYAKGSHWSDVPATNLNFIITNARYSDNWILQTAVSTNSTGIVYNRLIPRIVSAGTPRDWVCINNFDSRKKVLALGDSICRGYRNGEKGFVGDLGLPYKNKGISGAAISNSGGANNLGKYLYRAKIADGQYDYKYADSELTGNSEWYYDYPTNSIKYEDITPIPDKLILAKTKEIPNETPNGEPEFSPDIIIADGGINDYARNAPLGTIPTTVTTNINSLDASTVMGGLQRLFLLMINYYPSAHRYFVITHKTFYNNYYVATQNTAGYTQQDLHDAIVACCKVYNVEIIDVYERGIINTLFDAYRSQTHYTYDAQDNWASARSNVTDFVDADGIHPLSRGYTEGYVPLIREAIRIGTVKGD